MYMREYRDFDMKKGIFKIANINEVRSELLGLKYGQILDIEGMGRLIVDYVQQDAIIFKREGAKY
jgi:hypothetical protein